MSRNGWYAANTCCISNPVPIMLRLFSDFEGNVMNVLLTLPFHKFASGRASLHANARANFSQHASPYPANHAQWSSHSTFTDIPMPKNYDPCSLWSKNSSKVLLYYTAHSAMPPFLISRASDNVESRKRPNGTSPSIRPHAALPWITPQTPTAPQSRACPKVSTLGTWASEAVWSLFPKVGKTGQYCCYIHRLCP